MTYLSLLLLLFFQVGIGGRAGVGGSPFNAPTISAVTASADATTIVLQWTTNIASNSVGYCGSEQAVDSNVAADSTTHEIVVAGLTPSTAYTCTVESGSSTATVGATTVAAATSTPITGISFGAVTNYNTANGASMSGDSFYNFVSNDGTTYMALDDITGQGLNGSQNSALGFAKFTSLGSPLLLTNVSTMPGFGLCCGRPSPDGYSPKEDSLLSMGGDFYMTIARIREVPANPSQYAEQIVKSTDHGISWDNIQSPNTFVSGGSKTSPVSLSVFPPGGPTNFACSSFIVYGADDGTLGYLVANNRVDNANAYVYGISDGTGNGGCLYNKGNNAYLWRISRAALADSVQIRSQVECWESGDGSLDSAWTHNFQNCGSVLTNSGEMSLISEEYIPSLNRYLLLTFYYPDKANNTNNCVWVAYEAPHPWGPYTSVPITNQPGSGMYNPVILQPDALAATFSSTTMRVMFTGNFTSTSTYNLNWATMTVSH